MSRPTFQIGETIMSLETLLDMCKAYSELGWAVQQQLHAVADGEDMEEQNGNAVKMIRSFLSKAASVGVDDADVYVDSVDAYLQGGE
jgi:hypothetical protein